MSSSEGENFDMNISGSESEDYEPEKKKVSMRWIYLAHWLTNIASTGYDEGKGCIQNYHCKAEGNNFKGEAQSCTEEESPCRSRRECCWERYGFGQRRVRWRGIQRVDQQIRAREEEEDCHRNLYQGSYARKSGLFVCWSPGSSLNWSIFWSGQIHTSEVSKP